ncbi:uncharacterized protein MONBRDRAFT_28546 [Monosiga brevicollis MX1]|uniref:Uncharacterized protein n=1 Tax=Monosiga brevicollis TaxID=81824 RepID=A9V8H5_MONBE|nr:uncharacterized protein MONBRDRAFT_28546 [Monosiga brevicollis MX1]EDQ86146.1 predicted protein [Monosiga brevicollis MX1]|eukprot:XP_001749071.1 hypothetical protein [Monosiga brevicollis MX1]
MCCREGGCRPWLLLLRFLLISRSDRQHPSAFCSSNSLSLSHFLSLTLSLSLSLSHISLCVAMAALTALERRLSGVAVLEQCMETGFLDVDVASRSAPVQATVATGPAGDVEALAGAAGPTAPGWELRSFERCVLVLSAGARAAVMLPRSTQSTSSHAEALRRFWHEPSADGAHTLVQSHALFAVYDPVHPIVAAVQTSHRHFLIIRDNASFTALAYDEDYEPQAVHHGELLTTRGRLLAVAYEPERAVLALLHHPTDHDHARLVLARLVRQTNSRIDVLQTHVVLTQLPPQHTYWLSAQTHDFVVLAQNQPWRLVWHLRHNRLEAALFDTPLLKVPAQVDLARLGRGSDVVPAYNFAAALRVIRSHLLSPRYTNSLQAANLRLVLHVSNAGHQSAASSPLVILRTDGRIQKFQDAEPHTVHVLTPDTAARVLFAVLFSQSQALLLGFADRLDLVQLGAKSNEAPLQTTKLHPALLAAPSFRSTSYSSAASHRTSVVFSQQPVRGPLEDALRLMEAHDWPADKLHAFDQIVQGPALVSAVFGQDDQHTAKLHHHFQACSSKPPTPLTKVESET